MTLAQAMNCARIRARRQRRPVTVWRVDDNYEVRTTTPDDPRRVPITVVYPGDELIDRAEEA